MKSNYYPSSEIFKAWKEGRQLEWRSRFQDGTFGVWRDNEELFDSHMERNDWGAAEFRIKSEAVERDWKPEEIPLGAIIRFPSSREYNHEALIVGRHGAWVKSSIFPTGDATTMRIRREGYQCSRDAGRTWDICGVRE